MRLGALLFSTSEILTRKGANCYKPLVLRELIWSKTNLFHRLIHIFCGMDAREDHHTEFSQHFASR